LNSTYIKILLILFGIFLIFKFTSIEKMKNIKPLNKYYKPANVELYTTSMLNKTAAKNKIAAMYWYKEQSFVFNQNLKAIMNESKYKNKFEFIIFDPNGRRPETSNYNDKLLKQCKARFCLINPATDKVRSYKLRELLDPAVIGQAMDKF